MMLYVFKDYSHNVLKKFRIGVSTAYQWSSEDTPIFIIKSKSKQIFTTDVYGS